MENRRWMWMKAGVIGIAGAVLMIVGCEVDSASDVQRQLGVDFTGLYSDGGTAISTRQSGGSVTSLDLRQGGDRLEAVDNHGRVWRGSIGEVANNIGPFTLEGTTTVGQEVTLSGQLRKTGDTTATMTGTWIEPNVFGSVSASATVSSTPTNTTPTNNTNTGTNVTFKVRTDYRRMLAEARTTLWFMPGLGVASIQ